MPLVFTRDEIRELLTEMGFGDLDEEDLNKFVQDLRKLIKAESRKRRRRRLGHTGHTRSDFSTTADDTTTNSTSNRDDDFDDREGIENAENVENVSRLERPSLHSTTAADDDTHPHLLSTPKSRLRKKKRDPNNTTSTDSRTDYSTTTTVTSNSHSTPSNDDDGDDDDILGKEDYDIRVPDSRAWGSRPKLYHNTDTTTTTDTTNNTTNGGPYPPDTTGDTPSHFRNSTTTTFSTTVETTNTTTATSSSGDADDTRRRRAPLGQSLDDNKSDRPRKHQHSKDKADGPSGVVKKKVPVGKTKDGRENTKLYTRQPVGSEDVLIPQQSSVSDSNSNPSSNSSTADSLSDDDLLRLMEHILKGDITLHSTEPSEVGSKKLEIPAKIRRDPVALYHWYKTFWDRQKPPGEDRHMQLRWNVRAGTVGKYPCDADGVKIDYLRLNPLKQKKKICAF